MMSCIEIKHLYEFIDREIDKSQYFTIKKHLDDCNECHKKYKFEMDVRALVKAYCKNTTAPSYLHGRILENITSIEESNIEELGGEVVHRQKITRTSFSSRSYAIAASVLLLIAGSIFYYANYYNVGSVSIVDDAVKNHVVAVNNNLIFNEETSVVGNVNRYLGNTINTRLGNSSPILNTEQIRVVGGVPGRLCGTNSSCVVFDKGGNKLSLQTIRNRSLPIRNLEKAQLGPKEFYIGNCQGFNSVLWEENGVTYCLTSDMNKNEMLRFAATLTSH